MKNKWRERYRKKSIQTVILAAFSGISVFFFLVLAVIFTRYAKNILRDFIWEEKEQQTETLAESMEWEFKRTVDFFDTVYYGILKKQQPQSREFQEYMDFACEEHREQIGSLLLFQESGEILYERNPEDLPLSRKQKEKMFAAGRSDVGKTWFEKLPECEDILVYRFVEMNRGGKIEAAILAGTLRYEQLIRVFQMQEEEAYGYFYMKTAEGEILYHPKSMQIQHGVYEERAGLEKHAQDGAYEEEIAHKTYLVRQRTVGYTGWKIIGVASLDEALYAGYPLNLLIWSLFGIMGILAILINRYIVKRITKPIQHLSSQVERFGEAQELPEIRAEGTYEVYQLTEQFNQMQKRIRQLMANAVQKEQEYWNMQMKLLQSQINPHFLYNTLDSIIWLIQSRRYERAAKMVSALAGFFRISLNKGEDFITVGREMSHAEHYMEIQGIRFEDKFEFQMQCEETVKDFICPKLIIQPLAENAVYHGMEGMYGDGEIQISAYEKGEKLYIDVTDNGEGMSREQIEQVMYGKVVSSRRGSGIGVRNVDERLKHCFGSAYGISIISEIDEGTTVRICMPKVEDLNEYWKKTKNFSGDFAGVVLPDRHAGVESAAEKEDRTFRSAAKGVSADKESMD